MEFIKRSWGIIKTDILKVFEDFYRNGVINGITNETLICLIPMKHQAHKLKEFRPISLVTCLYKVIAKVLPARLRKVIGKTIVREQGAFVSGRHMIDLVLTANEVVEEF
ncbi:hypothetical protein Scep_012581 [Stephania cephalantha]|uniref:Reverse transcriptase domain-containing protein n=1 Tax=Stephania cephalantha TaxID=152367 RepID=A0AAP0JH42_9MAGN